MVINMTPSELMEIISIQRDLIVRLTDKPHDKNRIMK